MVAGRGERDFEQQIGVLQLDTRIARHTTSEHTQEYDIYGIRLYALGLIRKQTRKLLLQGDSTAAHAHSTHPTQASMSEQKRHSPRSRSGVSSVQISQLLTC
jgi:hypothetical protein